MEDKYSIKNENPASKHRSINEGLVNTLAESLSKYITIVKPSRNACTYERME